MDQLLNLAGIAPYKGTIWDLYQIQDPKDIKYEYSPMQSIDSEQILKEAQGAFSVQNLQTTQWNQGSHGAAIPLDLMELDGAGHQWYHIEPNKLFNAHWNNKHSGACAGNWFAAEFLQAPYITKDSNSITASVTGKAIHHKACIYQETEESCQFFIGDNGVSQMEFDYEVSGDMQSNWFSFWLNPRNQHNQWVQDCEIDSIENMWHSFAHNFAGMGHQTHIPANRKYKGHTSTYLQTTGAQIADCDLGQQSCPLKGDYAKKTFNGNTAHGIKSGQIKHHLYIDYWKTQGASSLKVSNIRLKAGGSFKKMCPGATPI